MDWTSVRKSILLRDEGKCRKCSRPAHHVHHRRVKGIGGTSDATIKYGQANLVSLCAECHAFIHAHPAQSYEKGWLVHSWQDPEDVPVPSEVKYDF